MKNDSDIKVEVFCTLSFPGFHFWSEACGKVAYLRQKHRHVFYLVCNKKVIGLNREIEFITLKEQIQKYVDNKYTNKIFPESCEQIGIDILKRFNLCEISVSEDGENGSIVRTN